MKAIKIVDGEPTFSECAEPRGSGVMVRVVSSSICATDLHRLPMGVYPYVSRGATDVRA